MDPTDVSPEAALARLYDLDLAVDPGDLDLYLALARRSGGPIVELCTGTGRIAVPLAASGYAVTGVDFDGAMLERARRRAQAAGADASALLDLVQGDIQTVSVPGAGQFAFGLIALSSLLLLGGPREQRHAMAVLASLLMPGGIAVLDVWLPMAEDLVRFDGRLGLEWIRTDPETGKEVIKTAAAWYDSATRAVSLTTLFEEADPGGVIRRWVREDALHLVSAGDLRLYAEDAGLEVEMIAGDYDLDPLEPGDGRAVMIARLPDAS